jgi:hypothetical protein
MPTKVIDTYEELVKKNLISRLEKASLKVIDYIMRLYDDELVAIVTDKNSKANPLYYRDEFLEKLDEFNFIETFENAIQFIVPSMNNFQFSGRLGMIKNIMEGTSGTYIEVDGEQYEKLFPNKKPPITGVLDKSIVKKKMIYLVKYTSNLNKRWEIVFPGEKMIRFPFSNTPPFRIFDEVNEFIDDNLDKWIDEAVDNTIKTFEKLVK